MASRIIPIDRLGAIGLIADHPFTELPMNAWTSVRNMRFRDGAVEKYLGHVEQLGVPTTPPQFLLSSSQGGTAFWLYASATKVGATNGAAHADITRAAGGDYVVNPDSGWTGTTIEDIPVINNGIDPPQMWNKPSLAQRLINLSNWPVGVTCSALTGLKRYLVALDVSKSGVRFPTMIKWSHQAPQGGVPLSWAETDETIDAGEYTLPGEGGFLVDGVRLRDVLILYKEYQTWQMQYVGGGDIFRFSLIFDQVGAINRRCAIEFFFGKHLVYTGDDVVLHDGQQPKSLVSARIRRLLANSVGVANYRKSFVAVDHIANEVLVCIPESGADQCTLAFAWNWLTDTWGVRELPRVSHIASGIVNPQSAGETWDGAVGEWDTDNVAWGDRISDPTKRRMLLAAPDGVGKLITPEISHQFLGENFQAFVERKGIGFPITKDTPPNYERVKQVLTLWPRLHGLEGGTVNITLGTQISVESPVVWGTPRSAVIGAVNRLDFSGSPSSRIHALRFESNDSTFWKLSGYDVEILDRGAL